MIRIPEWNINLRTGNSNIDYLHQVLLVLARKTIQAYDVAGLSSQDFHESLNRLAATADELFSTEEAVLAAGKDPTLPWHRAEHQHFREQITELLVSASIGRTIDREGLCRVLIDWATTHLIETDETFRTPRII
ncbi:bacteriohemerythrin [Zoogloea dura]|uniref:Hemerythrin family protein n=1 Tax=Zoogloea dura TaxID=2728840 RepID=A0A848FZX2_9RHOO|nr:hemerythrin family protein [Zoogloea dura]NML24419.1 hemerythrin family protein [Zoogloea dura]